MEGLVLELDLQLAQLVDLGGQAVLAERGAGLVRERVEEPDLRRARSSPPRPEPVGEHASSRPMPRSPGSGASIALWTPSVLQVARERAAGLVRRDEPRAPVAVHERAQLACHALVERLHDLEPARAADRDPRGRALAVGGEEADLRHLAAEVLERHRQQAREAGRGVGGARERPARLVEEREVRGLAALGEVGAVGEEDGQHGREQQDDRARVRLRPPSPAASPRLALIAATQVDIATIDGELARLDAVAREPHRRVDEQRPRRRPPAARRAWRRPRRAGRARLPRPVTTWKTRAGDPGGDRQLGEVEGDADRDAARCEHQHERGAGDPGEHDLAGRAEQQADHERKLAEGERVRAAAEVHVHDGDLRDREGERERPPGDVHGGPARATRRRGGRARGPRAASAAFSAQTARDPSRQSKAPHESTIRPRESIYVHSSRTPSSHSTSGCPAVARPAVARPAVAAPAVARPSDCAPSGCAPSGSRPAVARPAVALQRWRGVLDRELVAQRAAQPAAEAGVREALAGVRGGGARGGGDVDDAGALERRVGAGERAGGRAQQRLDLVGLEAGPRADQQRGGAGDDRGGLRGAGAAEAVADAGGGEGLVEEASRGRGWRRWRRRERRRRGRAWPSRGSRTAPCRRRRASRCRPSPRRRRRSRRDRRRASRGSSATSPPLPADGDDHEAVVPGALDGEGERVVAVGAVGLGAEGEVQDADVEAVRGRRGGRPSRCRPAGCRATWCRRGRRP